MNPEQIASIIRHLATFFGGMLVTKWAIPPEYVEAIVGGLPAVGALASSMITKKPPTIPPPSDSGPKP